LPATVNDLAQDLLGTCGPALLEFGLRHPDQQVLGAVHPERRDAAAFGFSKDCLGLAGSVGSRLFDRLRAGVVSAAPQQFCQVARRVFVAALDGASIGLLGLRGLFGLLQKESEPEGAHPTAPLVGPDQRRVSCLDVAALEQQDAEIGRAFRVAGVVGAAVGVLCSGDVAALLQFLPSYMHEPAGMEH
jgi:hypothetical protein